MKGFVRSEPSLVARIVVTLLLSLAALVVSLLLRDQIERTIFIFFWAALVVAAWYAGFWGALFVLLFGIVTVNTFLLDPRGTFELDAGNMISISAFLGLGVFVSWLADRMRTAERVAGEHARQLQDQAVELEAQMEENQALTEELETMLQETELARVTAETASRAKSEFLAVMSHELRTPLNAVVGYADLIQSGVAGPLTEKQENHLSRIRASAWHLIELIQDVLSFARMEAGREMLRFSDVETTRLARDAVEYIERDAAQKQLRVEVDVPAEPVVIVTDPGKLRQILLNLLSNAVKFTDTGCIGVRVRQDGTFVEFQVWDTGRGIDGEHHELVFEPFTQVDQSRTRQQGGVGLGLPVSRQLAELLGGTLVLTSERNKGTTFFLRLPNYMS